MRPLKVFIVDDDPEFSEGVALTLELAGHEVEFAASGEEAIQKVRDHEFDITLMDVRMPGLDGVESYFEIRKIKPDAKVIMMTAYSAEQKLQQALDGGALGVLHKPISEDVLLDALRSALPDGVILLADDDPDFADGIAATLMEAGYKTVVARDGREAVDKALTESFDVLLLDLRLPVLNGLEVYLELRQQNRSLPTVIVTGYAAEEAETIETLKALSVKRCLIKPVRSADLLQAIKQLHRE